MGLRQLLLDVAKDRGVEIDSDELDALCLSDEDEPVEPRRELDAEVLSSALPGSAAGMAEIFFSAPKGKVVEEGGLLWSPIAVEGQWAMRPDGKGGKVRAPLQLVAGHSDNQRRKIGLQDIKDNFDDEAVEDVTIPDTHNNGPLENHGYVEKLALVDGKVKGRTVKVLMAGEKYTDKIAEKKVREGSARRRSMGLLYDYVRTDTAKEYGVALEHVALTSKPWLRGMPKLHRPLSDPNELSIIALSLSDEGPSEADLETILSEAVSDDDSDFLAEPTVQWSHEESPKWLQDQVNAILADARRKKQKSKSASMSCEETVYYRCREAKPGRALISDNYDDGANYWVAGISVESGKVSLDDFKDWKSTKRVWVSDEREQPTGDKTPLSDIQITVDPTEVFDPAAFALQLAQEMRRGTRSSRQDSTPKNPPRGGGEMDTKDGGTLQLSDEARALIQAERDEKEALKLQLAETNKKVDKLLGTNKVNQTSAFIAHLKAPVADGGLGLSEKLGFGGMLVEIEQIMLADDGGPAVKSDHFADDSNKDGTLTMSEALGRVFGALRTAEGSTLKLGEVISPPVTQVDGEDGKPPRDDAEVDESMLSDDEILVRFEKDHPGALAMSGIKLDASSNGAGKDGD